jgi:Carboxypeptidase regulatory-like domain
MGTILKRMTTRKKRKKRFDPLFEVFRHPLPPFGHLTFVRLTLALAGLVWLAGEASVFAPAGGAQNSSGSHARVFIIFTTVFTDRGFALPGARARVRREDEKKFRWEATSDHQGELAFRVPPGAEYEMTIEARGFKPETRKIDARDDNQADLTIRMEPQKEPHSEHHSEPHSEQLTGGKP